MGKLQIILMGILMTHAETLFTHLWTLSTFRGLTCLIEIPASLEFCFVSSLSLFIACLLACLLHSLTHSLTYSFAYTNSIAGSAHSLTKFVAVFSLSLSLSSHQLTRSICVLAHFTVRLSACLRSLQCFFICSSVSVSFARSLAHESLFLSLSLLYTRQSGGCGGLFDCACASKFAFNIRDSFLSLSL